MEVEVDVVDYSGMLRFRRFLRLQCIRGQDGVIRNAVMKNSIGESFDTYVELL